jgi:hypothetical protein
VDCGNQSVFSRRIEARNSSPAGTREPAPAKNTRSYDHRHAEHQQPDARQADSGTWRAEDFGTSLPVPSFVWDSPESGGTYVGAHVVGAETVDGVETHVLTFFLDLPQTPVWFRLWSDTSGLVRRASMRAQGHFMDQRYTDFDATVSIEPPIR